MQRRYGCIEQKKKKSKAEKALNDFQKINK